MYNGTVNENTTGQNKSFDIDGSADIVSQQSCGFQIYAGNIKLIDQMGKYNSKLFFSAIMRFSDL
jgi:hypothetical protein